MSFLGVGETSSGWAICRRGRGGSFPVRRRGEVTGFALGAAEVGKAFQRAMEEVGRGS